MKRVAIFISAILLCIATYAKQGYKITIKAPADKNEKVYLKRLMWDEEILLDSITPTKKGVAIFEGKENLPIGEYSIKKGEKSLEIFISNKENFKAKLRITPEKIEVEEGNSETRYFIDFQQKLEKEWYKLNSQSELLSKIDSSYNSVKERAPGSLLETFLMASSSFGSVKQLVKDYRIGECKFGKRQVGDYLSRVELSPVEKVITMVTALLDEADTTLVPKIGYEAFSKLSESRVMGNESAAIHIAENYFLNGKYKAPESDAMFQMRNFTLLNKNSLVGMRAPELIMEDTSGLRRSISESVTQSDYTLLYFYTDRCVNCEEFTPRLANYMKEHNGQKVSLYAVYTGEQKERWIDYINKNFSLIPDKKIVNVYDPQVESSYHLLYGVISTPKLFLIDGLGIIKGRELSVENIDEIIEAAEREKSELYTFFEYYLEGLSKDELLKNIDELCKRVATENQIGPEVTSSLYRFLKESENKEYNKAALYVKDEYLTKKITYQND